MESKTKFVDSDSFLASLQPLYGLLREELLRKTNHLKQKLFWSKIEKYSLGYLIDMHMRSSEIYRPFHRFTNLERAKWKDQFEALLKKHELLFVPANNSSGVYLGGSVIGVDSHLCSGTKGDWGLSGGLDFVGIGIKVFSSQRESVKYISLIEEICHWNSERLVIENFFSDKILEKGELIETLSVLETDFKEDFEFLSNIIICCKETYNSEIAKLRFEVDNLERRLFWSKVGSLDNPMSLPTKIAEHKLAYSKLNLARVVAENKDLWTEWKIEFERLVSSFGLIFGPGKALNSVIDGDRAYMTRAPLHLCSGKGGEWSEARGFGMLMRSDRSARKNYLRLAKYIKEYASPTAF